MKITISYLRGNRNWEKGFIEKLIQLLMGEFVKYALVFQRPRSAEGIRECKGNSLSLFPVTGNLQTEHISCLIVDY